MLALSSAAAQTVREVPLLPVEPERAQAEAADGALVVGIRHAPPFGIVHPDGRFTGMAVDIFRLVAEDLGLSYRLEEASSDRPGPGSVVLPVEATAALEAEADLSQPVYTATLGLARQRGSPIWDVVRGFASLEFLRLVVGLSTLLLAVGAVVWAIERRRNDMFATRPIRGLGDGFWWAGVTLTTIGYGDKAPVTFWGRAVAMLWMLVGLAVSAALTAAIVTLSGAGDGALSLPEDLEGERVVALRGGMAEPFLTREGMVAERVDTLEAALASLRAGEADAVLAAAPRLEWELGSDRTLAVQTTRLDPVLIAFALPQGDPRTEAIDIAILELLATEAGRETVLRYLPDG
jgi:ABC-type amino acid transport substrate-binding protein